ncbi:general secretion pathway protein GspK [Luteimonas marina]|uniref:General secretion pathway protein GspK n=1 Tax=Luteimonas marina TaxID=488485 RepID=A0A5C5TWV7_9GAMM|nr:type II secretion system protein GspK [Luteimonas marina]TWT18641.1 general secretion pathway protein GspK [Luteimonas marina]
MSLNGTSRTAQQGGFVLVVVLALLVVLTLLAGMVALSGSRAIAEAQREVDQFQSDLDMLSTRESVLFMYATQHRNVGGLVPEFRPAYTSAMLDDDTDGITSLPTGNEIKLDGTAYKGLGDVYFSLQDDNGLVNINWAQDVLRNAFYAYFGAPAQEWNALDAKRLDYQDPDSLHRLNGAEAPEYAKAGLPPPPNRTVSTPLEFRRILQWHDLLEGTPDDALVGMLTLSRTTSLNLNTAPADVLAMLPGMDAEQAGRMVDLRRRIPFTTVYQAMQAFPIAPMVQENLTLFPKNSGNLILWNRHFGTRHAVHWTLTPMQIGGAPWHIDYEVTLPRDNKSGEAMAETPATPILAPQDPTGD